jgi:hypothetical protein
MKNYLVIRGGGISDLIQLLITIDYHAIIFLVGSALPLPFVGLPFVGGPFFIARLKAMQMGLTSNKKLLYLNSNISALSSPPL